MQNLVKLNINVTVYNVYISNFNPQLKCDPIYVAQTVVHTTVELAFVGSQILPTAIILFTL